MREPIWLTRRIVGAIHEETLREHGGAPGVRDTNAIESALARPRFRWVYGETSLATLAAAYGFGLAKNHGYTAGNKRVALMAAYVFLRLNGVEMNSDEDDAVRAISAVASGQWTEADFADWISGMIGVDSANDS